MSEKSPRFNGKTPSRMIQNESKEDYLEAIYLLAGEENRPIRSYELAESMQLSKPSVSRAVGILREEGFVEMDSDYYVRLTPSGVAEARRVYAKHTYFKHLLTDAGVSEEKAEQEACRMEHIVSDESFEMLQHKYPFNS